MAAKILHSRLQYRSSQFDNGTSTIFRKISMNPDQDINGPENQRESRDFIQLAPVVLQPVIGSKL